MGLDYCNLQEQLVLCFKLVGKIFLASASEEENSTCTESCAYARRPWLQRVPCKRRLGSVDALQMDVLASFPSIALNIKCKLVSWKDLYPVKSLCTKIQGTYEVGVTFLEESPVMWIELLKNIYSFIIM